MEHLSDEELAANIEKLEKELDDLEEEVILTTEALNRLYDELDSRNCKW